jgi:hypothetical protein
LFECICRDCGPTDSPDYRGELTASGPLEFWWETMDNCDRIDLK